MQINVNCPINVTSYGYVSSYFLRGLHRLGHDVRHIPIGQNSPDENLAHELAQPLSRWDFATDGPCLKIWHQHDLNAFYGSGKRIGMPIFELDGFNPKELHSLSNPDELIVCSKWAKEVIQRHVPCQDSNVSVVPLGYDDSIFYPAQLPQTGPTVFGNFGKWEVRKGHDKIAEIFNKAFTPQDDVVMCMMPHNFFLSQQEVNQWVSRIKKYPIASKFMMIGRQRTQRDVFNIMSQVHCGFFPSRAEGWNLEALELLASGRHLIITDCTGHTEFCDNDNSMLVKMTGKEKAYDGKWFNGDFDWHSLGPEQIDQMVEYLREIHRKHQDRTLQINQAGIESTKKYTWDSVTKVLAERLEKICW